MYDCKGKDKGWLTYLLVGAGVVLIVGIRILSRYL